MKKPTEPTAVPLEEMPEIDLQRFRRVPGRGHHIHRRAGEVVTIEADVWSHFGSAEAINAALRQLMEDSKKPSR